MSKEVTLRLAAEEPDADGRVRAALVVDLAPGWKTYWIDPGEAGIPPRIDLSGSRNLAADAPAFPAPHRFSDGYGTSNGYSGDASVALMLRKTGSGSTSIHASVMMGVCQQICIPVSATLALEPGQSGAGPAAVAEAFAALPRPADADSGVDVARLSADGGTLEIAGRLSAAKGAAPADVFVVGPKGWLFGAPIAAARDGRSVRFTVPVLERPRKAAAEPLVVDAVMTMGNDALETKAIVVPPYRSTPGG